jgi:ABC-type molybdate transport system ATPase subunit
MVAGLERPDDGEIVLRGQVVTSTAENHFDPPEKRNLRSRATPSGHT